MGALENFLKAPSSGRSREGEKYKASEKTLFYGIKIDAIVRFGFWRRHQNWCHSDENLFCFSFLAPKRSQRPVPSLIWRQTGANFSQNLLPHPYRNLRASKTTLILKFHEIFYWASCLLVSEACICLTSPFPYSNMKGKKNDILFLTFWKSFSTPIPHGFEAESKHRAENFLLLLYRNIQSQKVNTASKSFLKSPLFLYRNIERKIFNINFRNAANAPHSLTATSEAKKRHQFLKVPRKFTN